MGCCISFLRGYLDEIKRAVPSHSKINPVHNVIDYKNINNTLYRDLYVLFYMEDPARLNNPLFLYLFIKQHEDIDVLTLVKDMYNVNDEIIREEKNIYKGHMYSRVLSIYKQYNPEKLKRPLFIHSLLKKYKGHEHTLLGLLVDKYGIEPSLNIKNPELYETPSIVAAYVAKSAARFAMLTASNAIHTVKCMNTSKITLGEDVCIVVLNDESNENNNVNTNDENSSEDTEWDIV